MNQAHCEAQVTLAENEGLVNIVLQQEFLVALVFSTS